MSGLRRFTATVPPTSSNGMKADFATGAMPPDLLLTLNRPLKAKPNVSKETNRQCWGSGVSTRNPMGLTSILPFSQAGAQSPRLTARRRENGQLMNGEFFASGRMVGSIKSNAAPQVGRSVRGSGRSPALLPISPWRRESGRPASPLSRDGLRRTAAVFPIRCLSRLPGDRQHELRRGLRTPGIPGKAGRLNP